MMNRSHSLPRCFAFLILITTSAHLSAAPYYGEIREVGVTAPAPPFGEAVASFNTRLWSVSADGLRWSSDGNRWTDVATTLPLANRDLSLVAFDGRLWLISGELISLSTAGPSVPRSTAIWSSANGTSWRIETDAPAFPPRRGPTILQHEGALWLMGGFTETAVTNHATTHTYLNDIWRTANGTDWTTVTTAAPWTPRAAMAGAVQWGKMWLIGGTATDANAEIWFSSDGVNWLRMSDDFPGGAVFGGAAIGHGNYLYLVTAGDRTVWRSFNGREWRRLTNAAPWPARFAPALLMHGGAMTLVGGHPTDPAIGVGEPFSAWKSTDGRSWLQAGGLATPRWSPRWLHKMVVYDIDEWNGPEPNRIWIVGGHSYKNGLPAGDVWSSADGRHWSLATDSPPWGARWGHSVSKTNFTNRPGIWLFGGRDGAGVHNDVWKSLDGVEWTSVTLAAPWAPRAFHAVTHFDGFFRLFGGEDHMGLGVDFADIWSSPEGASWTRQVTFAPWGGRSGHAVTEFNGNLYLLGGSASSGTYFNDVWVSPHGTDWTSLGNAPWPARREHTAFVWNSRLWVVSGVGPDGLLGDVWFTSNGTDWHQETYAEPLSPRRGAAACIFGNSVWLTGGYNNGALDEIWTSNPNSGASLEWTKY